jgi:hypothetical protein
VAAVDNNLALLYRTEGKCADAEPLYKRAIAIYESSPGSGTSRYANVLSNYAELLRSTGRPAGAQSVLQQTRRQIAQR